MNPAPAGGPPAAHPGPGGERPPVLIVGSGFVGSATARHLAARGHRAVLASRARPAGVPAAGWTPLDATDPAACTDVLTRVGPDRIVLVHGPSDVTWCEAHPEQAAAAHTAATANITAAAARAAARRGAPPGPARIVLISTDNVFDGSTWDNDETTATGAANAYGRAKLQAERVLLARAEDAVVLRVSLVYGHEPEDAGKWLNFFAACAHRLRRGEPVEAPLDQWTTPVHVDDVAAVVTALLAERAGAARRTGPPDGGRPAGPSAGLPGLLHLGGPDRVTRADWAGIIADALGAPRSLVRPVPRAGGRYASRPRNTCLRSVLLDRTPATRDVRVRGVREAARALAPLFPPPAPPGH